MKPTIQATHISKEFNLAHLKKNTGLREKLNSWLKFYFQSTAAPEEFWALKDISFDVYPGQVLGLLGKNGAGKSTLLKLLARITSPTNGEIILHGKVASLLEVGTGFHPELTGRENIYLNGTILGLTKKQINKKFQEIVDFAEIEKFLDTPVKFYSSGMYVKLAFSVATAINPDIFIVDEVLAVGDKFFREKCLAYMQQYVKNGGTLLFVSHDLNLIKQICTHLLWLDGGALRYHGVLTPDILNQYLEN